MKRIIVLLSLLFLLLHGSNSHAAFVVQPPNNPRNAETQTSTPVSIESTNPVSARGVHAVTVLKRIIHPRDNRSYHENKESDAILAFIFGILGIVIWPLGIAALILGIRGSYRGNYYSAFGVIGLVLGALEIALMLAFLIFFIVAIFLI